MELLPSLEIDEFSLNNNGGSRENACTNEQNHVKSQKPLNSSSSSEMFESPEKLRRFLNEIPQLKTASALEDVCPRFLLAIRQVCTTLHDADLELQCFMLCKSLALTKGSKLVRKSSSAGLRILLEARRVANCEELKVWEDFLILLDGFEEPQFHLVSAMLPKLEPLIHYAQKQAKNSELEVPIPADKFSWSWLRLLLEKASHHSNGWIRVWTLQRAVKLPKVLQQDYEFFRSCILSSLNNMDILWRLVEKGQMEEFLTGLAKMVANLLSHWKNKKLKYKILICIILADLSTYNSGSPWNKCALFFISHAFSFLELANDEVVLGVQDAQEMLPKWRLLFDRVAESSQIPLRMATTWNFLAFLLKLYTWSEAAVFDFMPNLLWMLPVAEMSDCKKWAECRDFSNLDLVRKLLAGEFAIISQNLLAKLEATEANEIIGTLAAESIQILHDEDLIEFMNEVKQGEQINYGNMDHCRTIMGRNLEIIAETHKLLEIAQTRTDPNWLIDVFEQFLCIMTSENRGLEFEPATEINWPVMMPKLCQLLNTCFQCCQERQKSHIFLFNLMYFLRICFHPKMMGIWKIDGEGVNLLQFIQEKFDHFLLQAQSNPPLALIMAEQLEKRVEIPNLSDWIPQLVSLATFGPPIKHEQRVLNYAYQEIYKYSIENDVESNKFLEYLPRDRLHAIHLCTQNVRLFAINAIFRGVKPKNDEVDKQFIHAILRHIINEFEQWNHAKSSSFGLSMAHRHKTRLAQLLVLLSDFADEQEICQQIFDHCIRCLLDTSQQYSIKLLIEWTLIRLCAKRVDFFEQFLAMERKFASERVGSVCSWLDVIFHHFMATLPTSTPSITAHFRRFFTLILPWATAQNFSVRCTAVAALKLAWKRFMELHTDADDSQEFEFVASVARFDPKISTGNSARVVDSLCGDFYFAEFDPERHFCLQTILHTFPAKTGMPEDEQILPELIEVFFGSYLYEYPRENFACPILCTDTKFLEAPSLVYSNLLKSQLSGNSGEISPGTSGISEDNDDNGKITHFEPNENGSSQTTFVKNDLDVGKEVQRKFNTIKQNCNIVEGTVDEEKPALIVCATLVNKAANLGGLARTCEVFNAQTLCVANSQILESVEFKALSLNAEKWLHIEQVKATDLQAYLHEKRSQGYECVAAEQTTRSVPLELFKFPRRTVLLLGDEKEGICPELFANVDSTVEITQLGKTRSLNVHVSAALCIHQFAAQWLMADGK